MIKLINRIIDLLYFPFLRKIIPPQTFVYGVCGGANMLLDMILYYVMYHFVLDEKDLVLPMVTVSAEIAAFLFTFPIIFGTGLWLAKNITFTQSINSNRKQAFRYLSVTLANIFIKYFGIKLLIYLYIWPSIANAIMTVITVVFSYLMQKYYTFKGNRFHYGGQP